MPESMALLLEKYSPEQIAEVVDAVMKMRPVTSQRAAVASTTSVTPVSAITERKKRAKKSTTSKVAHSSGSIAPTRPLNSWMAFRSRLNCVMRARTDCSDQFTRLPLSHLQVIPAEGHLRFLDSHVAERPFQGQVEHPR